MSYFNFDNQPKTGITNANTIQAQVLWHYLSDPATISRQFPYSGTTTENALQVVYYGYALPGTLDSTTAWRIRKYVISGNTAVNIYPNGDNLYNYNWNYKTGYTYS